MLGLGIGKSSLSGGLDGFSLSGVYICEVSVPLLVVVGVGLVLAVLLDSILSEVVATLLTSGNPVNCGST